jgi:hypothetical protein
MFTLKCNSFKNSQYFRDVKLDTLKSLEVTTSLQNVPFQLTVFLILLLVVLHTVGPIGEREGALTSCYETCLDLVLTYKIRTVAFCGVSTGIFGYPLYPASRVALKVIRNWLEKDDNKDKVDSIIICTFLDREKKCYRDLLKEYFPLPKKAEPEPQTESSNNNSSTAQEPGDEKEKLSSSIVPPASLSTSHEGSSALPKETIESETKPEAKTEPATTTETTTETSSS